MGPGAPRFPAPLPRFPAPLPPPPLPCPPSPSPASLSPKKVPLVLQSEYLFTSATPPGLGGSLCNDVNKNGGKTGGRLCQTGTWLAYVAFDPKRADGAVVLRYSLDITQRTLCERYRRGSEDRLHWSNTHTTYSTEHSINIPQRGTSAVDLSSSWAKLQTIPYLRYKRCCANLTYIH